MLFHHLLIFGVVRGFVKQSCGVFGRLLVGVCLCATSFFAFAKAESGMAFLSDYQTILPNTAGPEVFGLEKSLLVKYLNNPKDKKAAKKLATLHLWSSHNWGAGEGDALKHAIISQYFLYRLKDLGDGTSWVNCLIKYNEERLKFYDSENYITTVDEQHSAHQYYREAFHYKEQNRHTALAKLLNDFAHDPSNVYTSFTLTAINLWMGSEADFDDPAVLYHFILGSYFSKNTIAQAKKIEENWLVNPNGSTPLFRLSSILGGFSLLQRRWMAQLHGDTQAIASIDDEHREWRLVNRAFHAFTFGIPFFEEPNNFNEGLFAIYDGLTHCQEDPTVRTCFNRPRFSFNFLGYILILVDFNLKAGDLEGALQFLQYRYSPSEQQNWAAWDLGRDAWLHREANAAQIVALYQNNDPSDDPLHFQMKTRKWGGNTTTCQTCHQVQGNEWTQEEFDAIVPPAQSSAIVGQWPSFKTTWWSKPL